jgi:hypothetical protein
MPSPVARVRASSPSRAVGTVGAEVERRHSSHRLLNGLFSLSRVRTAARTRQTFDSA